MKKIFAFVLLFIFSFTWIFADYISTEADKEAVKTLENIIPKLSEEKINKLQNRIPIFLENLDKNSRNYFLISEIYKIINKKASEKMIDELIWDLQNKETIKENSDIYEVTEVVDWDTIHFKKWNETITARLIGIDAPESTTTRYGYIQEKWLEATEKLKELIGKSWISVEYDESQWKTDKYWRDLVYVFASGKNINEEMIRSWFAKEYTYKKDYKYKNNFQKAEREAQKKKVWVWEKKVEVNEFDKYEPLKYYKLETGQCFYKNTNWDIIYSNISKCEPERVKKEREEYNKKSSSNYYNSSYGSSSSTHNHIYHTGKKWWCYYYSWSWKRRYVDRSFCY